MRMQIILTENRIAEVEAILVNGVFAVHKACTSSPLYTITHYRSGNSIFNVMYLTEEIALEAAKALVPLHHSWSLEETLEDTSLVQAIYQTLMQYKPFFINSGGHRSDSLININYPQA